MKKGFYLFFLMAYILIGCGIKGPLYRDNNLSNKKIDRSITGSIDNEFLVKKDLVYFEHLYIKGNLAYIGTNTVINWRSVVTDEIKETQYILFTNGLFSDENVDSGLNMLIGTPVNKTIEGKIASIPSGQYIQFKVDKYSVEYIPMLVSEINGYFEENAQYIRENKNDFMILKEQQLIAYAKVKTIEN